MNIITKKAANLPTNIIIMSKLLILITVLLLPFVGMSQTDADKIIGVWKVDVAESIKLMDADTRAKYDSARGEVKERAKKSMDGREFIFQGNGKIEARWSANGLDKSTNGTWELKDGDKLLITMDGQLTEYKTSSAKPNNLVLKNENGRGLFRNLYLAKEGQ